MTCTRPDLEFSVCGPARFMSVPNAVACKAASKVLQYVNCTTHYRLMFIGTDCVIEGFADADYGGDRDTSRSTSGFLFFLGKCLINWVSRLQRIVALSSAESEYICAAEAAKEAMWLRSIAYELGFPQHGPTVIREDNQSANSMSVNPVHHRRTKHMHIRYHYLKERVLAGDLVLIHIGTADQRADVCTKALARDPFQHHVFYLLDVSVGPGDSPIP